MSEVNQLVLDCAAKVLRINETTQAQLYFSINHTSGVSCYGWKSGYDAAEKEHGEKPDPDFTPIDHKYPYENIYLKAWEKNAEKKLRALLESLNALEKELLTKEEK